MSPVLAQRMRYEHRLARRTQTYYAVWSSGAVSDYLLQVGQSTVTWERFNSTVGNVLTYALDLEPATYKLLVTPSTVGKQTLVVS